MDSTDWEYTLYLVHLCPRLLDLSEFRWLKEKFYGILIMRLCSSGHDRSYWEAMERVRKDFTPTKPKTPEKKHVVARKFEAYRNLWIGREISKTCEELLAVCNNKGSDEDIKWAKLLRRIKIPRDITERELERLKRICGEEMKGEGDYSMLPLVIRDDLTRAGDKKEMAESEKLWSRVWNPIIKQANRRKPTFLAAVAKDTGLSKETIRKLLKQASKKQYD